MTSGRRVALNVLRVALVCLFASVIVLGIFVWHRLQSSSEEVEEILECTTDSTADDSGCKPVTRIAWMVDALVTPESGTADRKIGRVCERDGRVLGEREKEEGGTRESERLW